MEKPGFNSARPSFDSKRSNRAKRQSKTARSFQNSRSSKVSSIKEEEPSFDGSTINYREKVTNLFFNSFYSPTLLKKVSMKPEEMNESLSTLVSDFSSSDFLLDSYSSLEVSHPVGEEGSSIYSRESCQHPQKQPSKSNQSVDSSSNPSCASQCMCCWRVVFRNGNMYEGQLNDLIMHGRGIYYWTDGTLYRGEFKNGYAHGQGKLTLPDLSTYEGEFRTGFFNGYGKLNIKSSPILFNGQWRFSKKTGKGWCLYDTNNWYEGDWLNNQKHGIGFRHYANGDKYQGNWQNDKISGQGCMMWHNNDYYNGEWSEGYQDRYGEYTWNIIAHNSFIFPNYNSYKGTWMKGKRSGIGVMNFGHESGAQLAGTWKDNKKHGPGVMVCGNGITLEKNPLFTNDKPSVYMKGDPSWTKQSFHDLEIIIDDPKENNALARFRNISKQVILKKTPMEIIDARSLTDITKSGSNIEMKQYIKLLDKKTTNDPPLKIPIHNVIHEVGLEYFVEEFIRKPYVQSGPKKTRIHDGNISMIEIEQMIANMNLRLEESSHAVSASRVNYLPSMTELESQTNLPQSASQHSSLNVNEVQNLIINYLPELRGVYKMYASMCAKPDQPLGFEPVLIRMFLWQLYRDIGVTDKGGISIIEINEVLNNNPTSCLETIHSPWEPIYFWQFLQALVGIACLMYNAENHRLYYTPSSGFMYYMFKNFLDHRLLPNAGLYQGNCLTCLKDLAPVDALYKLYKDIGEPHTVEKFLKYTCLKKGETIPCYKSINNENGFEPIDPKGHNVTILNNEPTYLAEPIQTRLVEENKSPQKPYEGLHIFSKLGRKKILKCLAKICPQIMPVSIKHCQLSYRLSFIEFYEAILLLSFERVEQERLALLEDLIHNQSTSDVKTTSRDSRMSTHLGKRKKSTKK